MVNNFDLFKLLISISDLEQEMKSSNRYLTVLLLVIISVFFLSCSNDPTSPNLKSGLAGTWLVTRTIVTPTPDFPAGYQDIQTWTFTVNGDQATMSTTAGSMNGTWGKSTDFNYDHWIFEAIGPDPRTGFQIKIRVEIINVDKLKGTNETYNWDAYSSRYLIADAFSIEGVRQ